MTSAWLIIIPFLSAFFYWLTFRLALGSLFYPVKPKRILGFRVQGLIPAKQSQLAQSIGRIAGKEFSFEGISAKISNPENLSNIYPMVEEHIDTFLREKLVASMPMIAMFIGDKTIAQFKGIFMDEIKILLPNILQNYVGNLQTQFDPEKIIVEKLGSFPLDRLEMMVKTSVGKKLRKIELLSLAAGFVIGIILLLVVIFLT